MKKIKRLSLLLVIVLLFNSVFGLLSYGEERELTADEKKRVEDAVDMLKEMDETEWADDVSKWLKEGKLKVDTEIVSDGETDKGGTICLRKDFVKKLSKADAADPLKKWKADLELAELLVHEKVHAHFQAPNSDTFVANGRKVTDWDDSGTAYEICTGPEATEIEAYLKSIKMLLDYWEKLDQTKLADNLTKEQKTAKEKELQDKKDHVKKLINDNLSRLKAANYEKKDYIKDIIDGLWKCEDCTEAEKIKKIKEAVQEQIDGLFEEGGEFDRARKAVEEAKVKKVEKEPSFFDKLKELYEDIKGLFVSVEAEDAAMTGGIEFSLLNPYIPAPPGFSYVDFSKIDAPMLYIQYLSYYEAEIPITLVIETEDINNQIMRLFKVGETKPQKWQMVAEQEVDSGTVTATVDGAGVYAILNPESLFEDVPISDPNYTYIQWMKEQGKMIGKGDGLFGYGESLNKSEFSVLILKALGYEIVANGEHPFKDVDSSKWYKDAVAAAYNNKLVMGDGDIFSPEKTIPFEQAITIVVKGAGLEETALNLSEEEITELLSDIYDNEFISTWARAFVAEAIKSGLWTKEVNSEDKILFGAQDMITREKSAKLFYKLIKRVE